ncbi:hypothetical protein PBOI14_07890 [Pseudomonas sp. Boi14]|nr:hypothetical protein PBOI14_07890 [Pseudomonas sp. Boi14]
MAGAVRTRTYRVLECCDRRRFSRLWPGRRGRKVGQRHVVAAVVQAGQGQALVGVVAAPGTSPVITSLAAGTSSLEPVLCLSQSRRCQTLDLQAGKERQDKGPIQIVTLGAQSQTLPGMYIERLSKAAFPFPAPIPDLILPEPHCSPLPVLIEAQALVATPGDPIHFTGFGTTAGQSQCSQLALEKGVVGIHQPITLTVEKTADLHVQRRRRYLDIAIGEGPLGSDRQAVADSVVVETAHERTAFCVPERFRQVEGETLGQGHPLGPFATQHALLGASLLRLGGEVQASPEQQCQPHHHTWTPPHLRIVSLPLASMNVGSMYRGFFLNWSCSALGASPHMPLATHR